MRKRIVFLGNGTSPYTPDIFRGFLKKMGANDFKLVLNVDTVPYSKERSSYIVKLNRALKRSFNPHEYIDDFSGNQPFYTFAPSVPLYKTTNINDPEFLEYVSSFAPDYAILAGCPQIVKKEFLSCFKQVVNMHASLLPEYRGLDPVNWAMYNSETYTGFTYHYVNGNIDDGNIILQKKILIDYHKRTSEVMREISVLAGNSAETILQRLKTDDEGIPQPKTGGSYFGKKDKDNLLMFDGSFDYNEIQKRIRYWGYVKVRYKGEWVQATQIDQAGKILRIHHLPPALYQFLKKVKKGVSFGLLAGSLKEFQNRSLKSMALSARYLGSRCKVVLNRLPSVLSSVALILSDLYHLIRQSIFRR